MVKAQSSLLQESLAYAFRECIPLIATIEITQKCNFHCVHCYNFDRQQAPLYDESKQLTREEILHTIDQLADLGTLYINFSGGEALTHPHLLDFIIKSRERNLEPRLKTNGSLLSKAFAKKLYQNGLGSIDISLYGATEKTYQNFTGNKVSYSKTISGIKNALEANIHVQVGVILHRDNVHELDQMIQICNDFNVEYQISTEVTERYDGSLGAKNYEITDDQFIELLRGKYKDHFSFCNDSPSFQCSCARSVCGINHYGDVYPCIGAPLKSGNIREESLESIWKNSSVLNQIRGLKSEDFSECVKCDFKTSCNRSSGSIYINTKDYTGCDPVTYRQAKIRHELDSRSLE